MTRRPDPEASARFLVSPGHHLLVAYVDGVPAGFVSGVETTHPDKGSEMFLYELAVAKAHRRQGFGRALVAALRDVGRDGGCYGMWVLTDDDNTAALATYRSSGAELEGRHVMLEWSFVTKDPLSPPPGG